MSTTLGGIQLVINVTTLSAIIFSITLEIQNNTYHSHNIDGLIVIHLDFCNFNIA